MESGEKLGAALEAIGKARTVGEMGRTLRRVLQEKLGGDKGAGYESGAMVRLIWEGLRGWNPTEVLKREGDEVSDFTRKEISDVVTRLFQDEPIQYILGEARFYGLDLKVDRRVLIPRVETEELVDMIVRQYGDASDLNVLDVGTGSGAIAIALSRHLRFAHVTALDVSEDALAVARENAARLKARIDFVHADIFTWQPAGRSLDIIVSNPPYIAESEKKDMENNVVGYEPALALYVPDDNPLLYYSRISTIGVSALRPGGRIYFEINPRFAEGMRELLQKDGYTAVEIVRDFYGKERFAVATR